jgi:hypothetical protein
MFSEMKKLGLKAKKAAQTGGLCHQAKITLRTFVQQRFFSPWLPLSCV